ncbi:MAG: AMP-binding protein [Clostridium sp.]|nr:AMP-binding protein [Clostridium sp.]CDE54060.1 aMP-dependent synthetase and ligase [Clostridium sp. CAG:269]
MERLYKYIEITDLKDMLKKSGEKYGEKIAYKIRQENEYKEITHSEVRKMVDGLGTKLIDMGLKDKRIAVIGENRYEWEIAYLSIVCGTGTVVPLDKSLPENELESLIERSKAEAIICSQKYVEILKKTKLKYIISMDLENDNDGIISQKRLISEGIQLVKSGDTSFTNAKIDNEKMSIMLFTSGTTSISKAVALSHKNICSNLMDISSILDVNSSDVFLSFLPLHHVFECTVGFLFSLYVGAETVFCDGIRHIPENLAEYKVSVMASVPAIYERLFKIIKKHLEKQGKVEQILKDEEKYKDSSMEKKKEVFKEIHDLLGGNIKLFISGAASLEPSIEEKFRRLGFNMVQGYGLTETSPVVAIGNKKYHKTGSIGKCVPSDEVKLLDINKDGIGELAVKGPNVMLEYYENKEATEKVLKDGWFQTGDLARIDEDGYIFICGRKKSVIVLKNGKNIFPEEMETLINKEDGVEESFIFGKPISKDPNDIKIFVKIVYNKESFEGKTETEIKEYFNEKIKSINKTMPHYKAIRGIIISDKPLIKTTTNKIKREKNLEQIIKEL